MPKASRKPMKAPPPPSEPRPRPSKADVQAERFPNLDAHPALKRALAIHHALAAGKTRAEAESIADKKAGPRAPHALARMKTRTGKRPEPEKRQRVKPAARRSRR